MNDSILIILKKVNEAITEIQAMQPTIPPAPPVVTQPVVQTEETSLPLEPDVELDTEGVPWDARIHASTKTKLVKNGTWKLIRGVDPVLVAQVKTEGALDNGAEDTRLIEEETPPPGEDDGQMSWAQLMTLISDNGLAGEVVNKACQAVGVQNIGLLQDVPLLIPMVAQGLGLK